MAKLIQPLSEQELKQATLVSLRKDYGKLSNFYQKIINGELTLCPKCGQWKSTKINFYQSDTSPDGVEHYGCRECILNDCTDYDKSSDTRIDNKDKTIETFKRLDWYFDEKVYNDQLKILADGVGEKVRGTAAQQWIVMRASLNDYRSKKFADSVFLDEDEQTLQLTSKRKPRKEIIKLFGSGFTTEDYLYLQDQYDDWCARTQVDSKSQETYITQICFKQLEIWKAQKAGKDTDKLVKSLNDLMNGANLQPRQNVGNAATDSLTFGQLIEKWELSSPVPEPQEEFADPDNIGKFLRVWFKGSLMRALGLDGGYSKEYDDYIQKYTVEKPQNIDDDDSVDENMYEKVFGKNEV